MKANQQPGGIVAAGLLILQLVVVANAQPIAVQVHGSVVSQLATERSPESRSSLQPGDRAGPGDNLPGKADDTGDPALGGERHPLYRLSKLDVIEIHFTLSPEFNQTLTVQPDGFVSLRDVGSVFAEGLSVPELQRSILRAYSGILHEPEITITLKDFERPYFVASGQIGRPGKYELRNDLTVHEAVAIAGGFTQQAKHSQVVLFRRISAGVAEAHLVNLKGMLKRRDLREDLHLAPGDFIYVPQNRLSKVRKYVPVNTASWYLNPLQF